ncbi:hypothetical protein V5E38_10785 [Rossellomorea sp. GAMAL-10_SWC]
MTRKKFILITIIFCIFYLGLHATPSLAIRTKLFFYFHPKAAFTTTVSLNKRENNADSFKPYLVKHHAKAYTISHPPNIQSSAGPSMPVYKDFIVYKKGPIYVSKRLYDVLHKIINV